MRELGMILRQWEVKAILKGRKTRLTRIIKPQQRLMLKPYHVGDVVWVREIWQLLPSGFDEIPPEQKYIYSASHELSKECTRWRSSIHMPRAAARIFLKVTAIRVQRLQDITEEEAKAEGFSDRFMLHAVNNNVKENPWVWVIEFEKIE